MSDIPDIAAIRAAAQTAKTDTRFSRLVTPEVVLALCDAAEQLAEAEQDGKEMFAKFGKACDERDTAEQQLVAARVELSRIEHALDDPEKTCGELSADTGDTPDDEEDGWTEVETAALIESRSPLEGEASPS